MTKAEQQMMFLKGAARLILQAESFGLYVTGGELFRTQEQQEYFLRTGKSKIPHSNHQERMAIDLNFFKKGPDGEFVLTWQKQDIQKLGDWWEQQDPLNRWGGNWTGFIDTPHFERKQV